jgi:hypothetical protein
MWQKDPSSDRYTWQEALAYCENLTLAEYCDWRLPDANELMSIAYEPDVERILFSKWSSTTYMYDTSDAVIVYFGAYTYHAGKTNFYNVQAVRGGQSESVADRDCDGITDGEDNCPAYYNQGQDDSDLDGTGDVCDNCLEAYNPAQEDTDQDGMGDACDECPYDYENDIDLDSVCGDVDNCSNTTNPNQEDAYPPQGNEIGDACECESDFDCDGDVDGSDATTFKLYFGRNPLFYPCDEINPCRGDFDCDGDSDGTDAGLYKEDFGRNEFNNPCPDCIVGDWCSY